MNTRSRANERPGGAQAVLEALRLPAKGEIFDLDPGRFPGMPIWPGHPPLQLLTYRTPRGMMIQPDQEWLAPDRNAAKIGFVSEVVIASCHSGVHIDALAHFTAVPDARRYGGVSADEALGDFGPLESDASEIPPLITRGVLADVAGSLGVGRLPKGHPISLSELTACSEEEGVSLRSGDVVPVRTGQMSVWPDKEAMAQTAGAGITREAADWLVRAGVAAVGSDTESCEVVPSVIPGNPHPVHERLLIEAGIYIIENAYLEKLADRKQWEFLFLALPLKIRGATASMIRPLAVA